MLLSRIKSVKLTVRLMQSSFSTKMIVGDFIFINNLWIELQYVPVSDILFDILA